jgi:hypothetical protein
VYSFVAANYTRWYPGTTITKDQLDTLFQKCVSQNVLILYCPTSDAIIPTYSKGRWHSTLHTVQLPAGEIARFAIKFTGISLQTDSSGNWTGKYRLQHKIHAIYIRDSQDL